MNIYIILLLFFFRSPVTCTLSLITNEDPVLSVPNTTPQYDKYTFITYLIENTNHHQSSHE